MHSTERLIEAANGFERGGSVAGFARRIEIERAIFFLTYRLCRLEFGMELTGFNTVALNDAKERLRVLQASGGVPNFDVLLGFELRHQLVTLSLSEPYRFAPTEKVDSRVFRDFGRQLHKWTMRVSDRLGGLPN